MAKLIFMREKSRIFRFGYSTQDVKEPVKEETFKQQDCRVRVCRVYRPGLGQSSVGEGTLMTNTFYILSCFLYRSVKLFLTSP